MTFKLDNCHIKIRKSRIAYRNSVAIMWCFYLENVY